MSLFMLACHIFFPISTAVIDWMQLWIRRWRLLCCCLFFCSAQIKGHGIERITGKWHVVKKRNNTAIIQAFSQHRGNVKNRVRVRMNQIILHKQQLTPASIDCFLTHYHLPLKCKYYCIIALLLLQVSCGLRCLCLQSVLLQSDSCCLPSDYSNSIAIKLLSLHWLLHRTWSSLLFSPFLGF